MTMEDDLGKQMQMDDMRERQRQAMKDENMVSFCWL
jgi:hypothetical protein